MKKYLLFLLMLTTVEFAISSQAPSQTSPTAHKTQRKIIEELAGATALSNGEVIPNRSTFANRALTREYLQDLIRLVLPLLLSVSPRVTETHIREQFTPLECLISVVMLTLGCYLWRFRTRRRLS